MYFQRETWAGGLGWEVGTTDRPCVAEYELCLVLGRSVNQKQKYCCLSGESRPCRLIYFFPMFVA